MRYFILTSHYRSPLNYSDEHLDQAHGALSRLYTALRGVAEDGDADQVAGDYRERFQRAMDDDFNTAEVLPVLFDLAREINKQRSAQPRQAAHLAALLRELGGALGLLEQEPEQFLKGGGSDESGLDDDAIEQLIQERLSARQERNWAEADRIRDLLKAQGIALEDGPQGTTWRRS